MTMHEEDMILGDADPEFCALDDNASLVAEWELAKAHAATADAEVIRLREMLVKLLPDADESPGGCIGTVNGVARMSYRPHTVRRLSQQRLRQEFPAVLDVCTVYTTQWAMRSMAAK